MILIILISFFSFSFQSNSNIEKLLKVNKTKETTEAMVKEVLSMYKKRSPNVSVMTWSNIENSINYQSYYKKIKSVYSTNYTDAEISELIRLYNPKTMDKYTVKTKKIEQKLYDVGKEFGKEINQLVSSKIK